jgi:hypothetical protein
MPIRYSDCRNDTVHICPFCMYVLRTGVFVIGRNEGLVTIYALLSLYIYGAGDPCSAIMVQYIYAMMMYRHFKYSFNAVCRYTVYVNKMQIKFQYFLLCF